MQTQNVRESSAYHRFRPVRVLTLQERPLGNHAAEPHREGLRNLCLRVDRRQDATARGQRSPGSPPKVGAHARQLGAKLREMHRCMSNNAIKRSSSKRNAKYLFDLLLVEVEIGRECLHKPAQEVVHFAPCHERVRVVELVDQGVHQLPAKSCRGSISGWLSLRPRPSGSFANGGGMLFFFRFREFFARLFELLFGPGKGERKSTTVYVRSRTPFIIVSPGLFAFPTTSRNCRNLAFRRGRNGGTERCGCRSVVSSAKWTKPNEHQRTHLVHFCSRFDPETRRCGSGRDGRNRSRCCRSSGNNRHWRCLQRCRLRCATGDRRPSSAFSTAEDGGDGRTWSAFSRADDTTWTLHRCR